MKSYDVITERYRSWKTVIREAFRRSDGLRVLLKSCTDAAADATYVAALRHEHDLIAQIHGPGVPSPVELVEDGHEVTLVIEDRGHEPLPRAPLAPDLWLDVAVQLANALQHVHEHGIVHRDVNPSNVVLRPSDRDVMLVDFGIARVVGEGSTWTFDGTVAYASPEQTGRTNLPQDHRSDLYSLGVTLFELWSGELPIEADGPLGYVHAHLSRPARALGDVRPDAPEVLENIVARLLAKDPSERYQTARGLAHDLEECRRRWREAGEIAQFELGSWDRPPSLLRDRLAERDHQLEVLVGRPRGGLVVIHGPEGCGRSALIEHARRRANDRAIFVSAQGNEQLQHVPLGVFRELVQQLVRHLLVGSEDVLQSWRKELGAATGGLARVLLELVPDLEHLFGETPDLPELSPKEMVSRRDRAFTKFLGAVGRRRPLVLALDDLSRVDPATRGLLARVLADPDAPVTVVAVVERPEAAEDLQDAAGPRTTWLAVEPLTPQGVAEYVALCLGTDETQSAALGGAIHRKTQGYPALVRELLHRVVEERVVARCDHDGRWTWDPAALDGIEACESVLALMVLRLDRLSAADHHVLQVAACVGDPFEPEVVERSVGAPIADALTEALEADLLGRRGGQWRFVHPRIRAALLDGLDEEARASIHHRVATALLESLDDEELQQRQFELVGHLREAKHRRRTRPEREELLAWSRRAATSAMQSGAPVAAGEYLQTALDALTDEEWSEDATLRFELAFALAECAHAAGDLDQAELRCEELVRRAATPVEHARIWMLRVALRTQRGDHIDAIAAVREGLAALDVDLAASPEAITARIGELMPRLVAFLADDPSTYVAGLPEAPGLVVPTAMDLLYTGIPAAFMVDRMAFVLMELLMFELTITHGITPSACKMFADCGTLVIIQTGDRDLADRAGELARDVVERTRPSPFEASVDFVQGVFLGPWSLPHDALARHLDRAFRHGAEAGKISTATWAIAFRVKQRTTFGVPLSPLREEGESAAAATRDMGGAVPYRGVQIELTAHRALQGDEAALASMLDEASFDHPNDAVWGRLRRAMVQLLFGEVDRARAELDLLEDVRPLLLGTLSEATALLLRAWAAGLGEPDVATLASCESTFAPWAARNPAVFDAMHRFVAAEHARARGEILQAVDGYHAVVDAGGAPYLWLRGVACLRHAELWERKGQTAFASALRLQAHRFYQRWGASKLVSWLESRHPDLSVAARHSKTISASSTSVDAMLDVASVVEVTRAISSEVRSDRLFSVLMTTILENAGAQNGYLLFQRSGGMTVQAHAEVGQPVQIARADLAQVSDLAHSVVSYVTRTKAALVVGNASLDPRFCDDPHIVRTQVRSLLCIPVLKGGRALAVLYAENNAAPDVFTEQRMRLLEIIAGQAAASIENAEMYERLEQLVAERTRENQRLREAHEAADAANRAKDQFLANMSHELRTPLNAVLGYTQMVGEELADTDLKHLCDDLGNVETTARHLLGIIDNLLDLTRLGAGKVDVQLGPVSLADVAGAAVSIAAPLREQSRIRVDLADDAGWVRADSGRLRQVLANLLSNALKFCEHGEIAISSAAEGDRWVRIEVSDEGVGIPAESLPHVFERFHQADNSSTRRFGGTGLGLAVCREFVEYMGGSIAIDSVVGTGTTVRLVLPRRAGAPPDQARPALTGG